MKKCICLFLAMTVLLGCLTACNFTQNLNGVSADNAESTPKVKEMMTALSQNRINDAKALMHPDVSDGTNTAISQMSAYLAGRETKALEAMNVSINSSTGTSGKTRQENVAFKVTLTDNTVIYINAVYLSNNQGDGFSSFQLVLGVV